MYVYLLEAQIYWCKTTYHNNIAICSRNKQLILHLNDLWNSCDVTLFYRIKCVRRNYKQNGFERELISPTI